MFTHRAKRTPASPTHVRELWDFKAGSERSGPFESGEAVVFAFAVGFLPINVLSNSRIPPQRRSEDQMDCVAPPPALTPYNPLTNLSILSNPCSSTSCP